MTEIQIEKQAKPFPLGTLRERGFVHIAFSSEKEGNAALHLYRTGEAQEERVIPFPEANRLGQIRYMDLSGFDPDKYEYRLSVDGVFMADDHAVRTAGRETWGEPGEEKRYGFPADSFSWEADQKPGISMADTVICRLHVRGFTKHVSSGVKKKGTFAGILEKLPYLKSLGVTMIELQLPYEFREALPVKAHQAYEYGRTEGKLNYWGYGPADRFAPKAAFCVHGRNAEPADLQFRRFVHDCHEAGMEVCAELYFEPETKTPYLLDCLHYWVYEFHVDGLHLAGTYDLQAVLSDPALTDIKLFSGAAGEVPKGRENTFAVYKDDFQNDMRRFLKGDENSLGQAVTELRRGGKVNFMANTNGFTMYDMVSYDRKHNEANGENGKDGPDYNYSWNCGAEGPVKKKRILELRKRQLRNAWVFLTMAQGVPLFLAGDERGNSQDGNNNAYCQDNPTGWVNWKLGRFQEDLLSFVRFMLAFRREHVMIRKNGVLRGTDYRGVGCPDFSVHGESPWYPQYETYSRQAGLLYCGKYGDDSDVYLLINMHWEPHTFDLPHTGGVWSLEVDTAREEKNGICMEPLADPEQITLAPRSTVILVGETEAADER